jgi:hypothetical protein
MRLGSILAAALLAVSLSGTVMACGACIEDKVAATYDHAAIDHAIAKRWQVVFVAIDGPVDAGKAAARIAAAAPRTRGVHASTLRTSTSPPAFSFALDAAESPQLAVAAFTKAVGDSAAQLSVVRVMRDGARSVSASR